ncbi:MAG: SUMF1/EgtB/PvdO family nonheme iron enzyme [Saprospiraceae bacterium]|nr:SUMF1/EgtB/PvdO family nonheme iron enzyme [Saprospiraceae bacterium]
MNQDFGRFFILLTFLLAVESCKTRLKDEIEPATSGRFALTASISHNPLEASNLKSKHEGMIYVPPGKLDVLDPKTGQSASVFIKGFLLDSTEVRVVDFRAFVEKTGFKTEAEKFGNAAVFDMKSRTWGLVDGARWQYPQGPHSPGSSENDPVTQISWFDATAYCKWKGKKLPNELEWEHAARNGQNDQSTYSWGEDWENGDKINGNVWQGEFPISFKNLDGFESVAPVGSFKISPLGFKDLSGNVWEWCDNWRFEYGQLSSGDFLISTEKAMRGGSFLCAPNYCHGYQISARSFTTPETSLFHVGCRCAKEVE